jgi:hypothetical protein
MHPPLARRRESRLHQPVSQAAARTSGSIPIPEQRPLSRLTRGLAHAAATGTPARARKPRSRT